MNHTFKAKDVVIARNIVGGKLSWYSHVDRKGHESQQNLYGRILYFKVKDGDSANNAVAVLTREPVSIFGAKEFEQPAYKLSKLSEADVDREDDKVKIAVPHYVDAVFDSRERRASRLPMTVIAKHDKLPRAVVRVRNQMNR